MATVADNLATAKANFALRLAEISANPKPDYSVDGRSYSWSAYMAFLIRSMNDIDVAIQSEDGPDEVVVSGYT